jgi:hypothetical protein
MVINIWDAGVPSSILGDNIFFLWVFYPRGCRELCNARLRSARPKPIRNKNVNAKIVIYRWQCFKTIYVKEKSKH